MTAPVVVDKFACSVESAILQTIDKIWIHLKLCILYTFNVKLFSKNDVLDILISPNVFRVMVRATFNIDDDDNKHI